MSARLPRGFDKALLPGEEAPPLDLPRGRMDLRVGVRATTVASSESLRAPLDGAVLVAVALLSSLGIVMVYSTTAHFAPESLIPPYLLRHLEGVAAGLLLGLLLFRLPLARVRRLALPFWGITVLLLAATLVVGTRVNGAQRWLMIPGLGGFQPAEFAKLATILAVASALARRSGRSAFEAKSLAVPLLLALIPAALLLKQPDMGSAVVIFSLTACLVLLAGAPPAGCSTLVASFGVGTGLDSSLFSASAAQATPRHNTDTAARQHRIAFRMATSFGATGYVTMENAPP